MLNHTCHAKNFLLHDQQHSTPLIHASPQKTAANNAAININPALMSFCFIGATTIRRSAMTGNKKINGQVLPDIETDDPAEAITISQMPMSEPDKLNPCIVKRTQLNISDINGRPETIQIEVRKTRTFVKQEDKQSTLPKVARTDTNQEEGTMPTAPETALMDQLTADTDEHATSVPVLKTDAGISDISNNDASVDDSPSNQNDGLVKTAASSTEADSLPAPATCDVPFTAPEALQAEVAPQTLAERCEADRNLLTLKRQPSVIAPPDPNFQAGYVSWSDLVHSRWVEYFIHTPQVKKLIALAVKAALGTSAWGTPIQLVKMLERIRNLEDEQGCYNVVDDKPLGFPHAWLKAGLCAVYPPENGGGLVAENFWIAPEIIVKKNNQMLPAAADLAKTSVSRLNYATNNMAPGPCLTKNKFITRCLEGKRENHVLEFIRCGMPHVTGAPIIDREPPVVELPLLGLLYRECTRHKYFDQYCKGLEHLNLLFAEQSGVLEATALLCFDAVTMGNPDNIMGTLLQMATDTYLTAETEEARQAGKDALIARVHGWLYETFQLDILSAPQKFEKKLYTRMFSHPPVHLHW
ncbi:hypothetical protein EIC82_04025 [Enterobacter sp. A11]|uniref:IF-2-associated domain-containing protein n=1 Tax=unclassified Enterobacter TaxID=2608935 RepID=UPI001070083F|nr:MULTISPECIES: IF-2-associated domain-containing protein [unclassified Enterobacter]MBM1020186.1 IF-2-associated domain-containing protein [Enterobacter sp. E1]MEA3561487.1 IF-2-associated domain-containing protein [Enterobacter sp. GM-22]MEA3595216.1 IF-2-associated domain-containing protein [Enterobacter sp. GM-31]TFF60354.1 hypothetical protein EIC82_04025 [Enterobacter sp. A11]